MNNCILVFSTNIWKWGCERSTCSLCDYLQKQGYKVIAIIPRKGEIIELFQEIKVDYIISDFSNIIYCDDGKKRIGQLIKMKIRYKIKEYRNLRAIKNKIIRSGYNPVLVYSNTILFNTGIKIAKIFKIPHVQHIRENIDAFHYKYLCGYKRAMKLINKHSVCVLCTCTAIKKRYENDIDVKKMNIVYNGVQPCDLKINKKKEIIVQILQVSRYMDDKRIMDTLQSVKILKEKGYDNFHIDIYGQGEEEELYVNYINEYKLSDKVTLKGFSNNIPFQNYQIGLMTSTFEAFARTTLDYMNNALAVIASDSGGNIEQVINNETGLLFEVKNPISLSEKIAFLIKNTDKINEFGNNGRRYFMNNFTQENFQKKAGKLVLSCIKSNV